MISGIFFSLVSAFPSLEQIFSMQNIRMNMLNMYIAQLTKPSFAFLSQHSIDLLSKKNYFSISLQQLSFNRLLPDFVNDFHLSENE
jgi:hypothetical protein